MISDERIRELRVAAQVGMNLAAVQPHVMTIKPDELDELLAELQRIRPAYRVAQEVAKHWHDQAGINVAMLDKLENAIEESLPDPDPETWPGPARDCEACRVRVLAGDRVRVYADDVVVHDECPNPRKETIQ